MTVSYCKPICLRRHGDPQPRLTRDGYTRRSGSPTPFQVQLDGERIWRRVYVWCFSNAVTYFVRVKGEPQIVPYSVLR